MRLPIGRRRFTLLSMATVQIGLRIEDELLAQVDAHVAVLSEKNPGVRFGRSDALKALIVAGLDAAKGDATKPKKAKPKS